MTQTTTDNPNQSLFESFCPPSMLLAPALAPCLSSDTQRGTNRGSWSMLPPSLSFCSATGPPSHSACYICTAALTKIPALSAPSSRGGVGKKLDHPHSWGGCKAVCSCRENVHHMGWWRRDCALVPVIIPICYFPVSAATAETHKESQA